METMLDTFFNLNRLSNGKLHQDYNFSKEDYSLEIPLAGYEKNDLEITIENDVLTIQYKGDETRWKRPFIKTYTLNFDYEAAEAKMENGILRIDFEIPKEKKPKTIRIK